MTVPFEELAARRSAVQAAMGAAGIDAILVTTEPEFRYLTGVLTRFWESPSRPWFAVLPVAGAPIAVVPSIAAPLLSRARDVEVRSWDAPGGDDVALLAETLREIAAKGRIGIPSGPETHVRLPRADLARLEAAIAPAELVPDAGILAAARAVKSDWEIARVRAACDAASRAFDRVPEIARPGIALSDVFRRFQMLLLEEGADWVPYLAGGAGPLGYADVISPATNAPLAEGDVLMLDTGAVVGGYFCDFDRNVVLGTPDPRVVSAHGRLIEATHAGFEAARPGATAAEVFAAMDAVLTGGAAAPGRLGHGLGMQLTEGLSFRPGDGTVLAPGMVVTLEPAIEIGPGTLMVHEEDIALAEDGPIWLTGPTPEEIRTL